ncbi:hypothetical protein TNCV_4524731 [Trichonephila clavipes]|nr:hypothetical protein TNCV_4524731 [Trichonephila clavipes]
MRWRRRNMQIITLIAQTHITGDRSAIRKYYIWVEQIGNLKYGNYYFCVCCLPMLRGRHRSSFDQVSKINRRQIVYRDCGLSSREIGHRVGRN